MIQCKSKLFLLLLLVGSFTRLSAQMGMGKIEEIESVQTRKLIVMIEEPREKMLKKIAKKAKRGSVEDYKSDLSTYNANMKTVVEKFWPYNKSNVQYMTFDEIQKLSKSKTKDYAVLACISAEPSSFRSGYNFAEGLYWKKDIKDDFEDRDDDVFSLMFVCTIEDFGRKPVYYIPLYDVFPTKASLVYGIKGTETYFKQRINTKKNGGKMKDERELLEEMMAKKAPLLPTKTLLIRQEWLDKELTSENIKNYYPYPYKVCDREFMDKIVMDQDPAYVYGVELPYIVSSSQTNYLLHFQFVIDPTDNATVCYVKPSTGGMMLAANVTGKAGTRNFTIKTLEKIVEQAKGTTKAKIK